MVDSERASPASQSSQNVDVIGPTTDPVWILTQPNAACPHFLASISRCRLLSHTERGMGSGCRAIVAPLALTHGGSVACFVNIAGRGRNRPPPLIRADPYSLTQLNAACRCVPTFSLSAVEPRSRLVMEKVSININTYRLSIVSTIIDTFFS